MPKETYLPCLLNLFRQYGYDGATLTRISEATGLGKASLYHHFPGGKDEMVDSILAYLEHGMATTIVPALQSEGDALTRLQRMCDRLSDIYEGGRQPCLFAILLMGSARDVFHAQVKALCQTWITAMAEVLIAEGMAADLAQQRAEDGVIAVQGALILAQALDDPGVFQRVLQGLPATLCADASMGWETGGCRRKAASL